MGQPLAEDRVEDVGDRHEVDQVGDRRRHVLEVEIAPRVETLPLELGDEGLEAEHSGLAVREVVDLRLLDLQQSEDVLVGLARARDQRHTRRVALVLDSEGLPRLSTRDDRSDAAERRPTRHP